MKQSRPPVIERLILSGNYELTDEQTAALNAGTLHVVTNGWCLMTSPNVPLDISDGVFAIVDGALQKKIYALDEREEKH